MLLILPTICISAPDDSAVQYHLEQARAFYKKQWYADAAEELQAGLALDESAYELWWLAAQVAFARLDAEDAIHYATGAISVAPDPQRREEAIIFRDNLRRNFGFLDIETDREGIRRKLVLTVQFLQLDPVLADWTTQVQQALEKGIRVPETLSLPVGTYQLAGQAVEILAGNHSRLRLGAPSQAPAWVEVSLGAALPSTAWPGPDLGLMLGFPLGALWLNLGGHWGLQPYGSPDGEPVYDLRSGGAGLGLGTDLLHLGPLRLHPQLKVGLDWIPGIPVGCSNGLCSEGWHQAPVKLGLLGTALSPGLSLALLKPVGTRLRVGVAGGAELLVGSLPARGTAQSGSGSYSWTLGNRAWLGWRSSLRFQLSFALPGK